MGINNLEKLNVWRMAKDYAIQIYHEVIPHLPSEEKWAMAPQIRRSAMSIPANLAEGHGRFYYQEGVRYCYIARGSLEETQTYLVLAHDLGYLPDSIYQNATNAGEELVRLINGYIGYLKKARTGSNEPGSPAIHEPAADYSFDSDSLPPE